MSVWANVDNAGSVVSGQGLSVQHVGAGTYQVTITAPAVRPRGERTGESASQTRIPPGGQAAGAFPVAWYQSTTGLNQQFMVFTGVVVSGSFTPTDHTFTVMDTCM